jgi:hypothetical protein
MANLRTFLLVLYLTLAWKSFAQTTSRQVIPQQQTWLGYFNQSRFANKWGGWTDLHLRRTGNFVDQWSVGIARLGITYYLSDRVQLTAGYAYARHQAPEEFRISQPEHRPWQQIQWYQSYRLFTATHWLRTEQRYRRRVSNDTPADGYQFNHRIRYSIMLLAPLKGKLLAPKTPFLALNNELHINLGKEIIFNTFDQNRAFIGLGYQFTPHLNAQLGYMNVFRQLPTGNRFTNAHVIRFFVFHALDFRRQDNL